MCDGKSCNGSRPEEDPLSEAPLLGWGQDASVDGSQRLKWVWGSLKLLRVLMRGLASQKKKKKAWVVTGRKKVKNKVLL